MAEEENFEISHDLSTVTSDFQDRPLAFRVTLPLKFLAEEVNLEITRAVSDLTGGFRNRCLAFRLTPPVLAEKARSDRARVLPHPLSRRIRLPIPSFLHKVAPLEGLEPSKNPG